MPIVPVADPESWEMGKKHGIYVDTLGGHLILYLLSLTLDPYCVYRSCVVRQVMACSHNAGTGTRQGRETMGFLYCTKYCTHRTVAGAGTGTGNHCFLLCQSRSLSLSRSRAM